VIKRQEISLVYLFTQIST